MHAILIALCYLPEPGSCCPPAGTTPPRPPPKKDDRSESDFSAAGMVKEIEEMKKAGDKGKAPEQPQQAPAPAPAEPKK